MLLDLDETLIYGKIKKDNNFDFLINVDINDKAFIFYITKRPGLNIFL